MRANRRRDTRPELAVRSAVHAMGLRYRVDTRPVQELRRSADLVFSRARVAVFIDGCFWHGCPSHGSMPVANGQYWSDKIDRNQCRDRDTDQQLSEHGWLVIRAWEHEDPDQVARKIAHIVRQRRIE